MEKQREVGDSQRAIEELTATIQKAQANIETHTAAIGDLSAGISSDEKDVAEAEKVRAKEHADFSATDAEMADVVSTLERAINEISRALGAGSSFAQIAKNQNVQKVLQGLTMVMNAASVDGADKAHLQTFLQSGEDEQQAPAAAAYESHDGTSSILDVLRDMLDKAESQKSSAEKAEMEAKHSFMLTKQSLTQSIETQTKELGKAKQGKAANEEVLATAQGDLSNTQKELAEDTKALNEAHDSCEEKANDWNVGMQERAHEVDAIEQAIKIIQEKTGGATGQAYGLIQTGDKLGKKNNLMDTVQAIFQVGKQNSDRQIAMLAVRVRAAAAASADPFAKVKGLISEMIDRLEKDAAAEASQKAFCDKEYAKSKAKKQETESSIESLSAKINRAEARVAKLKREIATLTDELSTIAADQSEATKLRQEQHAAFLVAEKDYSDGLEGLNQALKILRDYFGTSLLQQSKSTGAASSIIGILEVAESDFGKLLAEAREVESSAQAEFDQMSEDNKIATATKKQDVKYKNEEIVELTHALSENNNDRSGEQEELDAVMTYVSKLNDQCIAKVEPYEERKRRREQEIEGLKNALEILEGEAIGFLSVRRAVQRHF
mmetsp:Transcript_74135/g.197654  ORF Transcript_74135/g.197654 Transcript_74135/m.197654 type:complete len:609 (-) Transcript_74135:32-1858(-)